MQLHPLLLQCRQQNVAAQKCLYGQFATAMFLLCRRYVKTAEEAEEVMLSGFLKFFEGLQNFVYVSDAATVSWLKKIMVNECLMHLRGTHGFIQLTTDSLPDATYPDTAIDDLSAEEIFVLITQLPIGYRTVFNLAVVEGLPHKEIAELLRISEGTSRSQLSKAKTMLQQLLIKNNPDHAWRKTK